MSLRYRYAVVIIAKSIALVMRPVGGKMLVSMRLSPLARYGWKRIRYRRNRLNCTLILQSLQPVDSKDE